MRAKHVLWLAIALTVAAISIHQWLAFRASQASYDKLISAGALAQRDDWGRVRQINRWPKEFSDEDFALLENFPHLKLANLAGTPFADDDFRHFAGRLETLVLANTQITDAGLRQLAEIASLRHVTLTPTAITPAGAVWLKKARPDLQLAINSLELHGMARLRAAYNGHGELNDNYDLVALDLHDSAVADDELQDAAACKQLRMINLSGTNIGDAGLSHLRGLKNVQELWLSGTSITDEGMKVVAEFPRLRAVSLAETGVTDAGIAHLKSLEALEVLHVGATEVTDDGLQQLSGLRRLKEVHVSESGVTTDGAAELAKTIPAVKVYGGAEPEKPIEDVETRVLG